MGDLGEVVLDQLLEDYFREIFNSTQPSEVQLEAGSTGVTSILTPEEEVDMDRDIGRRKWRKPLKNWDLLKPQGRTGFHAVLYYQHWDMLDSTVTQAFGSF